MNDSGFTSKEKLQELADKAKSGYILTERELNALSPILHPYIEEAFPYAYVFPQNPDEPIEVKINTFAISDFDIEEFERKFLEVLNNDNKKSD